MRPAQVIETFNDRYPFVGPAFWIISIQYFIIQLIVGLDWAMPYSLAQNTISDLGNTACGNYIGDFVCSPRHSLMNASFIMLGITMIAGSAFIYREFRKRRAAVVGFTFMAIAGFGSLLVGLFPENTIGVLHYSGALAVFLIGNVGIVILGASLSIPKSLRVYTLLTGTICLVALVLFVTGHYVGLGKGGTERLTGYPQTIWLIIFGIYMSRKRFRQ